MITFKFKGQTISVATEWHELTYKQYLLILDTDGDLLKEISALTGVDYDLLKSADKINGVEHLIAASAFLRHEPQLNAFPDMIGKYKLPKNSEGTFDIQFESLAQFEDMRQLLIKATDLKSQLRNYPSYIAIYLQKVRDGKYDFNKADEMVKEIEGYSCIEVLTIGTFFFSKLTSLLSGIQSNSPKPPTIRKRNIGQRSRKSSGRTR